MPLSRWQVEAGLRRGAKPRRSPASRGFALLRPLLATTDRSGHARRSKHGTIRAHQRERRVAMESVMAAGAVRKGRFAMVAFLGLALCACDPGPSPDELQAIKATRAETAAQQQVE